MLLKSYDVGGSGDGDDDSFDLCVSQGLQNRLALVHQWCCINRSGSHVGYPSSLWELLAACAL